MNIVAAAPEDFPAAFSFIQALWDYNTYDREKTQAVYRRVLEHPDSFFCFLKEGEEYLGFCHGDFFDTFWMEGLTCYLSSLYVRPECRRRGCGRLLLDHARALARARGCKALVLDSGLPRREAHRFYQGYGMEKSCYGFELIGL